MEQHEKPISPMIVKLTSPTHSFKNTPASLILIASIVVINELVHLIGVSPEFTRTGLGLILLFAVIYVAFRYGLWPSIINALIANIYYIYALSGPGRDIVPLQESLEREWLVALLFFLPAAIIGYLRDKIDQLIQRERQARIEAEEGRLQLARILEEMPVGVAIAKAPTGELTFSNRHLDQLMGRQVPKHSSLDDYPRHSIIDEDGKPLPEQHWPLHRVVKKRETLVNEDYLYQVDADTRIRLQVKGAPIFNNEGQIISGVVIVDDVTAEKELIQRKDDFLSMVSHELKTPVTSLKVYTQLLLRQLATNPSYNPLAELRKIDNQTQKIQRIINNMMDLATIQLNKGVFQTEPIDMSEIVHEVIQDIKHTLPDREIVISQLDKAPLLGDRDRLAQVVSNLVTNAIKYSPENSPVIIESVVQDHHVKLSVQDYGIGISPKERTKIFDRFYQENQKDGKIYPGLGLGLYFSAEIIKQHQGRIWVESKKGHGSTFYISLPINQSKQPANN